MAIKEPIYCSLAFGSASIDHQGYKPCCNFQSPLLYGGADNHSSHINDENLIKVRDTLKRGEWHRGCKNCKDSEDAGYSSMRTIWNLELGNDIPMDSVVDPKNIRYLDLTFSNKCNSKCMTCSTALSSLWGDEWNYIWSGSKYEKNVSGIIYRLQKENNYLQINIDDTAVDDIINLYPNVVRIAFVGGEPTIHDEGIELCKKLIKLGRAKNITISYVTNLTGLSPELIDMWHQFKSVQISVSIDGYNKVNEYIRYPFKWKKIEENVIHIFDLAKKYPGKYTISLSHTVSLLNIMQSHELLEWWWDLSAKYNKDSSADTGDYIYSGVFLNKVWSPEHLKTNLLSKEFREQCLPAIENLEQKIKDTVTVQDKFHNFDQSFLDQIGILKSWVKEPQVMYHQLLKQCLFFIKKSDDFRKRSIADYIPIIHNELENMNENMKDTLTSDGRGYDQIFNIVPSHLIDSINSKKDMLYPVRASTHKKQYAEGDACKDLFGIAVWWSQLTDDWHEVQEIHKIIYPEIKKHMSKAVFYASDIVTINGPSRWVSPHVDTPHRFPKYNKLATDLNLDLLGIQVIIPLEHLDKDTGATGFIPGSHEQDWDINDCYNGVYDGFFKDNAIQLEMPVGSILFYNTRLMHSTMPMNLPKKRSILLINYLRSDIIDNVRKIDNVWTSNGKS